MRKYIVLLSALLLALTLQAQNKTTLKESLGDILLENKMPTNFSYQALIARDGKVVAKQNLKIEITLQDEEGNSFLVEEHTTTTSNSGLVKLPVGAGNPKSGKLEKVDWNKGIFVAVRADFGKGYESLGAPVKIMATPYALYAANAPLIRSNTTNPEAPIFQVQNSEGFPLFTVYEGGYISMNVSDDASTRRPRGGFAVKTFSGDNTKSRLQIADGRTDIGVDPITRRPRGGFSVKTYAGFRDGQKGEPKTLFNINDRATYFTLDQTALNSSFQLRSRCDDDVIMAFTKGGNIQTQHEPEDVLERLPTASGSTNFEVGWQVFSTPISYEATPGFTNLLRWRLPRVTIDAVPTKKYDIRIVDDPTTARLSDYLRVGKIRLDGRTETLGLVLAANLVLDQNFTFPNGKIMVSSTEIPSLQKVIEFKGQKMLPLTDILEVQQVFVPGVTPADTEFSIHIKAKKITTNADLDLLLLNANIKYEILDDWDECLEVEPSDREVKFTIRDRAKFDQKAPVGITKTIRLQLVLPNSIYKPVEFECQFQRSN